MRSVCSLTQQSLTVSNTYFSRLSLLLDIGTVEAWEQALTVKSKAKNVLISQPFPSSSSLGHLSGSAVGLHSPWSTFCFCTCSSWKIFLLSFTSLQAQAMFQHSSLADCPWFNLPCHSFFFCWTLFPYLAKQASQYSCIFWEGTFIFDTSLKFSLNLYF